MLHLTAAVAAFSLVPTGTTSSVRLAPPAMIMMPPLRRNSDNTAIIRATSSKPPRLHVSHGTAAMVGQRRIGRETLLAKGLAFLALLRFAYRSPLNAALAIIFGCVVVVAPVVAVEAVLFSSLLCLLGTASYWPANIFVFAMSTAGVAGAVNGCLVWWEARQAAARRGVGGKRRRRRRRQGSARDSESVPEDESAGLLILTIGTITAAIVGALP